MKKRGCLLLVILIVFTFLTITLILAQDEVSPTIESLTPFTKYDSILLGDGAQHINMCLPEQDCSVGCDERSFPPETGCRMYAEDEVGWGSDDGCYTNALPLGYNIDERIQSTNERFEELSDFYNAVMSSDNSLGEELFEAGVRITAAYLSYGITEVFLRGSGYLSNDNENAKEYFFESHFNFKVEQGGIICGNDHYWYQCDAAHEGTLYWIEAEFPLEGGVTVNRPVLLYECQEVGDSMYAWVHQGTDLDGDSYLSTGGTDDGGRDCVDFGPLDENMGCPNVEDYQGKTREEIRDLLKETCNYPSNSRCAACINPSAPEVCGDHINNDCGGTGGRESSTELAGNTPDYCNKFQAGCEQKTITEANRVRENVEPPAPGEETSPEVQHYNVYDEQFSWTPTADGGYCCGYGGINDLGENRTTPDGNSRICLNRNTDLDLVGREGDIPSCDGGGPDDAGDWCWATAALQGNAFHIFTIKKPGEPAYDVVSNNNNWYQCKDEEGTKGISTAGAIFNSEDLDDANRFYCYKEGNRWSWADCRNPDELTSPSVNGIKERAQGDGLFAFPLQNPTDITAGVETVFVDISTMYAPFYADGRLDFKGYEPMYLEFYLRFKTFDAEIPPEVRLKIQGPQQEGQYIIYYDQPILGYAVNNPLLEANRWIHIKVPLSSEMLDVKSIEIKSMTSGNSIEVQNIYLGDGFSRICSGTRSSTAGESSWLTDLDFSGSQSTLSAEKLCNALFDPAYENTPEYQGKAWLGDDDEVDIKPTPANCCGNNENEYYAGPSKLVDGKYYGCWNSEPIASGSTTMNVEFGVEYEEPISEIVYPPQEVIFNVERRFGEIVIRDSGIREGDYVAIGGRYELGNAADADTCTPENTNINRLAPIGKDPNQYGNGEGMWANQYWSGSELWLGRGPGSYREDWKVWLKNNPIDLDVSVPADQGCWFLVEEVDDDTNDNGWLKTYIGTTFDASRYRQAQGSDSGYDGDSSDVVQCIFPTFQFNFPKALICNDNKYWSECSQDGIGEISIVNGKSRICTINSNGQTVWGEIAETLPEEGQSATLTFAESPQKVAEMTVKFDEDIASSDYNYLVGSNNDKVHFFFLDSRSREKYGEQVDASELGTEQHTLDIMAETEEISVQAPQTEEKDSQLNFVCHQSSCSYPLPGEPPYTITNSHPDLYELYFVGIDDDGQTLPAKLITPTNNHFRTKGMIQARKVAQQVIYVNEGEETDTDPLFYGCQAASYIVQAPPDQTQFGNLNYCSTKAEKFCAYSVAQEDQREKFTTINSWSDEAITKVGYVPIDQVEGDVNNFYDSTELQLRDLRTDMPFEEAPVERNFSTSVLPTRNFISNAQFIRSGPVLPHWDIRLSDGTRKENLRSNLINDELHSITLEEDETLRSEQIAVPANTKLSFSATATCTPTIHLVDKDGVVVPITVPTSFNAGTASYLQLEFTGPCTLHSPLLQVVDDLPSVSFNYLHQDYPDGFDARAGAACCPEKYCWNGYACVEPMGSSTYLAEHVADGRDYRCIEGQWKYMSLQFDWNHEKGGFCAQPEQCLVLPSTLGGSAEYTAPNFYEGHYPTCINDGEYLFDNLCNKGNWTSRTKFVATKLLEVGENSDYVLYCTTYRQALLEFDNRENYLGGEFVQQSQTAPTLDQTLSGPAAPAVLATCFNTIQDPQGRRLIPDDANTCINNVCVVRFKQGGDFKVAFATTVNKDIMKEDSFLFSLNIPQNRLNQLCSGTGDFVKCDLTSLDIPGDLWYSKKLNATIYGKQGIQITPTAFDRILNWLARFVGVQSELSDEGAFISQAQNFREVYVLSIGDKKVRALKEVLSADKQTLMAEYEHFSTPVCDYVKNIAVPPEAQTELLEQLSGQQNIVCNTKDGIQRVEAVAGLDFFWPQLTGRMRVG